jgi:hypothetical protein
VLSSIESISIVGIIGYVVIMTCLAYMGVGFARSLKDGKNGITLGLMCVFFSLAFEHLYLSAVSTALLYPAIYNQYILAFWLWRMLTGIFVLASFTVLFVEFYEAGHDKKPIR